MNKATLGFLSMESYFGLKTTVMIQYWRSADLMAYAKKEKHLTAWRDFNKKVGRNKAGAFTMKRIKLKEASMKLFTRICLLMD